MSEQLKPGNLVAIVKWWKEGDTLPEGWTEIGQLNAERVAGCPECKTRAADETSGWRPIGTAPAPKGIPALFWVVPKPADECYTDTDGNPIVSPLTEGRIQFCPFGHWSALSKATHWMPAPLPPEKAKENLGPEAPAGVGVIDLAGRSRCPHCHELPGVAFLQAWMRDHNPLLGGITPLDMLKMGRGEKLASFIEEAYAAEGGDEKTEQQRFREGLLEAVELTPVRVDQWGLPVDPNVTTDSTPDIYTSTEPNYDLPCTNCGRPLAEHVGVVCPLPRDGKQP